MSTPTHDVTQLLHAWGQGDLDARERVVARAWLFRTLSASPQVVDDP